MIEILFSLWTATRVFEKPLPIRRLWAYDTDSFDHSVGHLAYIPTTTRRDLGFYAQAGEYVVCNKDYIFSVTLLLPQGSPRQISLCSACHAPPCGHHGPPSGVLEGKGA
jgi:hypothetical protein